MDYEKVMIAMREAIHRERKAQHITQEELAEMLNVTPTHIKHIESGHRKPSLAILFEIAICLNISLDAIVFPDNAEQNNVLRNKIDHLLNSFDNDSLQFILTMLEALQKKESFKD